MLNFNTLVSSQKRVQANMGDQSTWLRVMTGIPELHHIQS